MGLLSWMLGYAYLIAVIPAWLTAGVDWALSAKPFYLRLVATMAVAAILTELTARYLSDLTPFRKRVSFVVLLLRFEPLDLGCPIRKPYLGSQSLACEVQR